MEILMAKPKLTAKFQPQQWIHDDAVDCAPFTLFEAGELILAMNPDLVRYVSDQVNKESGLDLDILAEAAGLVGNEEGRHNGPFCVSLDKVDLEEFLSSVGIDDLVRLDESILVSVRADYAAISEGLSP
jgi:hypothetical protein